MKAKANSIDKARPTEQTALLLRALNNPHEGLKYIHIAGTNAKGSVAAFTERILREAGYKTGLFTSPHIHIQNERIRVNGENISDESLNTIMAIVEDNAARLGLSLSYFQAITAAAFYYFKRSQVDIAILETGLGGRLDPTNIIGKPEIAVLTRIGLDHMAILGKNKHEIAKEKAGIIKPGCAVIYPYSNLDVQDVILEAANGCKTHMVMPLTGREYELGLDGEYQLENAALAVKTCRELKIDGKDAVSERDIKKGLAKTRISARFEIVNAEPVVLLDGAHNKQAVEALMSSLKKKWDDRGFIFIAGFMADKAYQDCIDYASRYCRAFIATSPGGPRALSANELAIVMRKYKREVYEAERVDHALERAFAIRKGDEVIAVFGSLYLAARVRLYFGG